MLDQQPATAATTTTDRSRLHDLLNAVSPRQALRSPQLLAVRALPSVSRPLTALAALALLLGVLLPVASTLAIGNLVGSVPPALGKGGGSAEAHALWLAFAVVGGLYVAQQTVLPLLSLLTGQLSRRFGEHIQQRAMRCVSATAATAHLEDPDSLREIEKATGRATGFPVGPAITVLSGLWTGRLGSLASAVLIFRYHWWVAVPLLVVPVALMRFWRSYYEKTTEAIFGQNQELRRTTYLDTVLMSRQTAAEVRVFGLAPHLLERAHQNWQLTMGRVFEAWKGDRLTVALAQLIPSALSVCALLLIVHDGISRRIDLASVSVLVSSVFGVAGLGSLDGDAARASMMLASLPALDALELQLAEAEPTGSLPVPDGAPRSAIAFEGVSFTYPGRATAVYDKLDLVIEAGCSTAIVGVNGAGKTTLVKLLARMREPDEGRITVDGVDLASIAPLAWQRRVAAIFQSFVRYELSVYDNIALGAPERQHDRAGVEDAARRAGILGIIEGLPQGWDTPLTRQLTGGGELSGGQWQRLALARALFATAGPHGARVLVLDEPTASLDVRTEADLYERFLDLTAGLTTIVISHRFSTVRRADRIVVLDHGRVVEQGSHDELMAGGGRYAELFALQAARYVDLDLEGQVIADA